MAQITFTNTIDLPKLHPPKPASQCIPDWYKDMESYVDNKKIPAAEGASNATIKRCMPVFDSITSGYILFTFADVWITQKPYVTDSGEERVGPFYEWPSFIPIEWHPVDQAPNHPLAQVNPYPKWMNPWSIKTPPGYSTMIVSPVHRDLPFTLLSGVVDTDLYTAPINFPFVLNDLNFEGLIPSGTPMAQVIPFKREIWEMNIGNEEDFKQQDQVYRSIRTKFFDSYKSQYRQIKEYR